MIEPLREKRKDTYIKIGLLYTLPQTSKKLV